MDTLIAGNTADYGGAVAFGPGNSNLRWVSGQFIHNVANVKGGAFYVPAGGNYNIDTYEIYQNSAPLGGMLTPPPPPPSST